MPESHRLRNVRNTLSSIVTELATGLEPLSVRLERQFRAIKRFTPEDFPEDLQDTYERSMNRLIIEEQKRDAGQLPATLEGMPDHTAQLIAKDIVRLYQGIEREYLTK